MLKILAESKIDVLFENFPLEYNIRKWVSIYLDEITKASKIQKINYQEKLVYLQLFVFYNVIIINDFNTRKL